MRILQTLLAATVLILCCGSQASACRAGPRPLAAASREYDTIVLVTVQSAGEDERFGERPSWRAVGTLRETILGDPGTTPLEFGRTGSSAACDDGQPMPPVGDVWVLYLRRQPQTETLIVEQSQPLKFIGPFDPRLKDLKALRDLP